MITISPSRDRDQRRDLAKRRSRDLVCRRERKIRDRDRRFARSRRRSRSMLREIAPSIAISPSQDRAVNCDLAKKARSRLRRRSQSRIAIDGAVIGLDLSSLMIFFWVVACVFLDLCFPSSFPNTRKYFPEIFLKCNQTHANIFLLRKLAFPENMYFSKNVLRQSNTA